MNMTRNKKGIEEVLTAYGFVKSTKAGEKYTWYREPVREGGKPYCAILDGEFKLFYGWILIRYGIQYSEDTFLPAYLTNKANVKLLMKHKFGV